MHIPMMTSKKCFVTAGLSSSDSHPSNFKPPESNAFSSFRSKYGAASPPHLAVSNETNPKPNAAAGFTRRKDDRSFNGKIPRSPDKEKYEMAIPAVPLRSVPIDSMKRKAEKPVSSHGIDHDEGRKSAKTCNNMVNQKDELWKQEVDKLAVVIAEAKEFISLLDSKYSTPITFPAAEDLLKDSVESKDQHSSLNSDAFSPHTSIDQSLSRKRLKVSSGIAVVVQEKNASGTETMPEDEDGDEVILLSPAEWIASQLLVNRKDEYVNKHQGINIVDYIDPVSIATEADQPGGRLSNCDLTETKCSDLQGNDSMDPGECSPISEGEQYDDVSKMFPDDDEATYSMNFNKGHAYLENHKELVNLEIVQHDDPRGRKVMDALKLFKEEYNKVLQDHQCEPRDGKIMKGPHFIAAECVKAKGMVFFPDKPFGHIPGIEIGHEFYFRAELTVVGLNRQFTPGIDYITVNGTQYATSVVNSGRYENKAEENDILIYYGQGGNPNISVNGASDQKLEKGNLALYNSMNMGFPVRVIQKRKGPMESKTLGFNDKRDYVYVYDGLYNINNYWHEKETQNAKWVYKFELQRLPGQPRVRGTHVELGKQMPATQVFDGDDAELGKDAQAKDDYESLQEKENLKVVSGLLGRQRRKQVPAMDICVLDDISQGKENFKVRAMNGIDDDHPPPFNYTTNVVYPRWYWRSEPVGCECIDGCADSVQCPCVKKNGGEIPYTEKARLMKANDDRVIHECGPSCKCPPTCMNRVSQGGLRFQLEIFKTKSMGWGVRSRNFMEPGSFICEYIGELLDESEAEERIGKDEYLFDICHGNSQEDDFALDAAKFGNVGRFINHSCDPNVFAQKVFYDHDDERMPHIMFFASKRIPPGQELMYDYNYTKIRVRDAYGNIKRKACCCGSRKCTGRLY